ncbi:MAG: hypothetical protein IKN12_07125 [Selenomonadaceae bacterium]|nr:hypothetical protein [Selenomonadaceae bacterium]
MTDFYYVCKLNKSIYSVITNNITTDEVIITQKQIQHIKDRHPEDYDFFAKYGAITIEKPDYILEANKPLSAMILKEIEENGKKLKLILRLKTSTDPIDFKNSVITFQVIDEKRFNRYIKNGKILYNAKKL